MQLLLDTKGIDLSKRNNCFCIRTEKRESIISPSRVTSIAVWSLCKLSSAAIKLAIEHQIPIYFLDAFGEVVGRLGGASFGNQTELRRKQIYFRESPQATDWILETLHLKAKGQIANLKYIANRKVAQAPMLTEAIDDMEVLSESINECRGKLLVDCADTIRGKEGSIARLYWQALSKTMPSPLDFKGRIQQNPPDAFNSTLNYLYGILYGIVETAIYSVGLDPYMAMLHGDQDGKPTLSYDLIEVFRPMTDRFVIEFVLTGMAIEEHYTKDENGTRISKKGKAMLVPAFFDWMEEKILLTDTLPRTRKNQVYQQAGNLKIKIEKFT